MKKVIVGKTTIGKDSYEWAALRFKTKESGGVIFYVSKNGGYFMIKDIHCKSFSKSKALVEIVLTESQKRLDSDFEDFVNKNPMAKCFGVDKKNTTGMPKVMFEKDFQLL